MKQFYKKIILLFGILLIASCSKEQAPENSVAPEDVDIYRSQVVTIQLPDAKLTENEYQGVLDGVSVTLMKSENDRLIFLLPYATTLGAHKLTIPSLNNKVFFYNVLDTTLSGTPEETLESLFNNLNSFSSSLDATTESINVKESILSFKKVFDNSSLADKTKIAMMYKANKKVFDDVFKNYNSATGRLKPSDIVVLAMHSYAVYVMAAGALVTIYAPEPAEKLLGIVITAVGAKKAIQFFSKLTDEQLNTMRLEIGSVEGTSNKMTSTELIFEDNVDKTISLNSKDRKLIESDENKSEAAVVSFFKVYKAYNYYIGKINVIIEFVNSNIPFADFGLIPLEKLPVTSPEVKNSIDSDTFKKINFTIADSNLTLVSAALENNGELKLKIKINGTPASFPVKSFLNYTYADDFSSFSGKVPIEVSKDCSNTTLSLSTSVNGYNAVANVTGGVSPYTYLWSNGSTSNTVSGLAVGSYSVEVKDALGCSKTKDFTIGCKDVPTITGAQWICNGAGEGVIARVSFTAGTTGILIGGGSGSCDTSLTCYPVRLYFFYAGEWNLASNGYNVNLVSGDKYKGVLDLTLTSIKCSPGDNPFATLEAYNSIYKWKVELINPCNERTEMGL